jgi:hypothetical protein
MLCRLCEALPQHTRTNKDHEHLHQVGLTERISKPGKIKAAWLTHYVCAICNTRWQHIDDPADATAGWSIEQYPTNIPECYAVPSHTNTVNHPS